MNVLLTSNSSGRIQDLFGKKAAKHETTPWKSGFISSTAHRIPCCADNVDSCSLSEYQHIKEQTWWPLHKTMKLLGNDRVW